MENEYLELIFEADDGCTGIGLSNLLCCVGSRLDCHWCVLSDIDLVGSDGVRAALGVSGSELKICSIEECLRTLPKASQVVWASIFLCDSLSDAKLLTGVEDYVESLKKSAGLVRAIDGSEYMAYLPSDSREAQGSDEFQAGEFSECREVSRRRVALEKLAFPE